MANYNPPTDDLPIFDTLVFTNGDTTITQNQADKRYLRFPIAQGLENLSDIVVNGTATFNSTTEFNGMNTMFNPNGQSALNTLIIRDPATGRALGFNPNAANDTGDPFISPGDAYIGCNGQWALSNFTSTRTNGVRFANTNLLIGYGGTGDNPNNTITFTDSAIQISANGLTFSDTKVQNSAFTGGTAGTYTNTNMTIDTNGRISAISSGGLPFTPRFANYSDYQTATGVAYSQGTKIVCGGSWGVRDYIMIRITAQGNWGDTGAGWQYYAATSGQLIFRPQFAPSGTWASIDPGVGTAIRYPSNTQSPLNTYVGNVGKPVYYTGNINNGNTNYFTLGGVNKEIQFAFQGPGITGGWEYTHLIEYIVHSSTGGTVSIQNGTGTNATNNILP
jgi:hypothetical protein